MNLHIANADDLISILDRVLGKSIVIEAGTYSSLREFGLAVGDKLVPMATKIYVASSAIYNGYGEAGTLAGRPGTRRSIPLLAARTLEQIAWAMFFAALN